MLIRLNLRHATCVFRQTGPDVELGAALAGAGVRQAERGADPPRAVRPRLEVKYKRAARSLFRQGKHIAMRKQLSFEKTPRDSDEKEEALRPQSLRPPPRGIHGTGDTAAAAGRGETGRGDQGH